MSAVEEKFTVWSCDTRTERFLAPVEERQLIIKTSYIGLNLQVTSNLQGCPKSQPRLNYH